MSSSISIVKFIALFVCLSTVSIGNVWSNTETTTTTTEKTPQPRLTTAAAVEPTNSTVTKPTLARRKRSYGAYANLPAASSSASNYYNSAAAAAAAQQMNSGSYDFEDNYGENVNKDYAFDYYDWICSDSECKLCDVLTSECCDPVTDENCYMPDSCLNNPCLGGGTCISTLTVDNRTDFVCVCLPGLTGKFCQLKSDYATASSSEYPQNSRMQQGYYNSPSASSSSASSGYRAQQQQPSVQPPSQIAAQYVQQIFRVRPLSLRKEKKLESSSLDDLKEEERQLEEKLLKTISSSKSNKQQSN